MRSLTWRMGSDSPTSRCSADAALGESPKVFTVRATPADGRARSALSEKVLSGDPEATKKYLKFISSGRSKYPIDLLKEAGIDMSTDEPLELTMRKMNRVMDDMEKVLDRQGK